MDAAKQAGHLGGELDKLIERFRDEYDLPYMTVVGVLETKKQLLILEAIDIAKKKNGEQGD